MGLELKQKPCYIRGTNNLNERKSMSAMSQIHAKLLEQANELGYESISEAESDGYKVAYHDGTLDLEKVEEE